MPALGKKVLLSSGQTQLSYRCISRLCPLQPSPCLHLQRPELGSEFISRKTCFRTMAISQAAARIAFPLLPFHAFPRSFQAVNLLRHLQTQGGRHAFLTPDAALPSRVSLPFAKGNRQNGGAFWSELVVWFCSEPLSAESAVTLWAPPRETPLSVDTSGAETTASQAYHKRTAFAWWQLAWPVLFFPER